MKKLAIAIFPLVVAASMAVAASTQFKAGDISFSVMDKDGATPMQAASIQMLGSEDGALVTEASTDELGQAILAMDEGRYVLRVNDINLALFEVGAEGLSVCRVIMPDASLLVGGQEQDDNNQEGATASGSEAAFGAGAGAAGEGSSISTTTIVVGTVGVIAALGVAYPIVYNNTRHGHGKPVPVSVTPVKVYSPTIHKSDKPSPSPSAI